MGEKFPVFPQLSLAMQETSPHCLRRNKCMFSHNFQSAAPSTQTPFHRHLFVTDKSVSTVPFSALTLLVHLEIMVCKCILRVTIWVFHLPNCSRRSNDHISGLKTCNNILHTIAELVTLPDRQENPPSRDFSTTFPDKPAFLTDCPVSGNYV